MITEIQTTSSKAIEINLNPRLYGTFAEIGAAQETARWFFRVGGAAGTIAKSMSAYDMTFSDSIYGPCERYVSRARLRTMLDHEYQLLRSRLETSRGASTCFFAFANTVAAQSFQHKNECHGWLGVRFQREPMGEPHEIILHVRMLDRENLQQQEALGIIGVNFLYAAFHYADDPDTFTGSLMDDLSSERIETDLLLFSGPDFEKVDNRLVNLMLLQKELARSIVFSPEGEVLQAAEHLYKCPILLERGNFRPVTKVNLDMMDTARAEISARNPGQEDNLVEIMEITLRNLLHEGGVDPSDFLARIDLLGMLGKTVMISNYSEFHRLTAYLRVCTRERLHIVLGVGLLKELFDKKYYTNLEGGLLESCGRLFKNNVEMFVYPGLSPSDGQLITADNFAVESHLTHLYAHLRANDFIRGISATHPIPMNSRSVEICSKILKRDSSWEAHVAPEVARRIKERGYFGWED